MKPRRGGSAWQLSLGAVALTGVMAWANLRHSSSAAVPREASPLATQTPARTLPRVTTLHEQRGSAYDAGLFADASGVVLITRDGFTRIRPGQELERRAVDLGPVAVLQGGSIAFWRSGKLREIALSGAGERELAAVPSPPQFLLASEARLAWIHSDRKTGSSLRVLSRDDAREVYHSPGRVCAAALRGSDVYWVLQDPDGLWTIDRVNLDDPQRVSTAARRGRPPAMLALGRDGVYFYAGPQRGVLALTFDLAREDTQRSNVICSPIVVSSRVVCAQVGGLFEIPRAGEVPRFLASEPAGPIAATAATDDHAFWVAENGDGRLVVRTVPLSEP